VDAVSVRHLSLKESGAASTNVHAAGGLGFEVPILVQAEPSSAVLSGTRAGTGEPAEGLCGSASHDLEDDVGSVPFAVVYKLSVGLDRPQARFVVHLGVL
jgi:hypothetical protein